MKTNRKILITNLLTILSSCNDSSSIQFGSAASLPACTNDNSGACTLTEANKTLLEPNLISAYITQGITIFGVTGSYRGPTSGLGAITSNIHKDAATIPWSLIREVEMMRVLLILLQAASERFLQSLKMMTVITQQPFHMSTGQAGVQIPAAPLRQQSHFELRTVRLILKSGHRPHGWVKVKETPDKAHGN